jgi:long-chain acyl-CoA synthetase
VLVSDRALANTTELTQIDIAELPTESNPMEPVPNFDPSALALLIYTSGTTGSPKGVMLDHANVSAMVAMIVEVLELSTDDRSLLILPLFHVYGIVVSVLSALAACGSTTITGRFTPTTFFETVEAVRPTYFSAVPTIYSMLVNLPDGARPDTTSVRFAICGAAPMPAELISQFEDRYRMSIVEGYGLSECTCAATINPLERGKPGTVGLPLPGQEVALRDDVGSIGRMGRGEVVLRGPNVMRGYLNKPEDTALTLADGWLRTGDVGYFDDDGYLVLVDRVKDTITRGGENIYPKEIENVLYAHPDVVEAAVVARSHDVFGEEPVAFVSLRRNATATPDELIEHCRSSLSRFKVPRGVFVLEKLPKNPVGKISKLPLRELVARAGGPAS